MSHCLSSPKNPTLSLTGVTIKRGSQTVLTDINLRLQPGESWLVIGDNGAGKTTLLQTLCGLLTPFSGEIRFKAQPLTSRNVRQLQQKIAYIPQDLGLVEESSVEQNVLLGVVGELKWWQVVLGRFKASHQARADFLLKQLGIAQLKYRPVKSLSGGERKKVAIARAFMGQPEILLVDEMLSDLSPQAARRVLDDLRLMQQHCGFSTVFVEHHVTAVLSQCDGLLNLQQGRFTHHIAKGDMEAFVHDHWLSAS